MANPNSRQTLIDYCLRSLGSPVIEINIDDDQVSDRIDEAIQFYQNFHSDAVVRNFYKYQITQTDFNNRYITLPDQLIYVLRVLPIGVSNGTQGIFSVDYQLHLNDLYDLRRPGNLINYEMTRQYLSLLDIVLNGMDQGIIFSRHMQRLEIECDWPSRIPVGSWVVVECYQTINPDDYPSVYNDQFLKRYATALIKRNWAQNLFKFKGMVLPGGVTIDGTELMAQAKEEIKEIEAEARSVWETPVDFYVG
jgi:hypothetical protein